MVRTLFVIAGAPRSGTSTLSRAMRVFGAAHGANLLQPQSTNPKGFWEDSEVLAIDEALLAANHSKWSRVGFGFNPNAGNYQKLQDQARRFLNDAAARSDRFAIKEPRMTKLLDFWKPLFLETGWNCRYIIALRNPVSVAASLQHTFQIEGVHAALLWSEFQMNAINQTTGENRIILDYDRLLADPEGVLRSAGQKLGESDPDPKEMRDFCDSFLTPRLRHSTHDLSDVFASPDIPAPVAIFYSQLLRCASGELSLDSEELKTSMLPLQQLWRDLSPVWQWLARLDDEVASLTGENTHRVNCIADLHQTLAVRDADISEFRQTLTARDGEIDQLRQHLADRGSHIAGLTARLAECQGQLANRDQIISEGKAAILKLTSSKSWKLTQPLRRLNSRLSRFRAI